MSKQGTGYLADNKANTSKSMEQLVKKSQGTNCAYREQGTMLILKQIQAVCQELLYIVWGGGREAVFVISGVIMKEMLINKTVEVRR